VKTKGISIVERHGEKAIVGVFAALALGVVAWQFVGSGNRVTVEGNQKVEPDRAYDAVRRRAEQVAGQIADPNPAAGIPERVPDAYAMIMSRVEEGLRRADEPLPVALGLSTSEFEGASGPIDDARYGEIVLPLLSDAVAAQYLVTLNPLAVVDSEALAAVAPAQQPYDIRAVSVQATLSGAEVRAMLEADPDGDGPLAPLPRTFWLNRTAPLDVRVERQRLLDDGDVGPVEVVPPSPRAVSFADRFSPGISPGEYQTLVRDARAGIASVVQPPFPPTIAGDIWVPPAQAAAGGTVVGQNAELTRLRNQLAARETDRDDVSRRLNAATSDQARNTLTARLETIQLDIDRLKARIVELDAQNAAGAAPQATASSLPEPRNIESSSDIVIVAHDLTAEPGATYRYRVSLGMTNPLFPWAANLQPDQQALAEAPVLYTEPSAWSQPVRVAPPAQVFFTRASGGQEASAVGGFRVGDASAEVFGLYYGHWRGSSNRLAPGDTLAATIPLPDNLPIFDIAIPEEGPPTIAGRQPGPASLTVALEGAMLVDVIEKQAGAARTDFIAVVRLPDGRLVLRDTSADQQDPALAAARRSAAAAASAVITDPSTTGTGRAPGASQPARQGAAPSSPGSPGSTRPGAPRGGPGQRLD